MPELPALRDHVLAVVRPALDGTGLDLETVTVQPAGRRRVVRVVVDRDGGVNSDQLAEASRQISRALDDADAMGSAAYTLELSTPGVDRPLTEPRHWRRARTRLVKVQVAAEGEEPTEVRGRVVAADDDGVDLEQDGTLHRYPYESLGQGRIEVEFRRAGDALADDATAAGDEGETGVDAR